MSGRVADLAQRDVHEQTSAKQGRARELKRRRPEVLKMVQSRPSPRFLKLDCLLGAFGIGLKGQDVSNNFVIRCRSDFGRDHGWSVILSSVLNGHEIRIVSGIPDTRTPHP